VPEKGVVVDSLLDDLYNKGPQVFSRKRLLGERDLFKLDALKVRTAGRVDGRWLYYFGAIKDDNQTYLAALTYPQKRISDPSKAYCRIIVEQA
jgi:hypothetical protein